MAIDTDNKKFAVITFLQMWMIPMPISPGTFGQDDKQHLLAGYPGILWAGVGIGAKVEYFWRVAFGALANEEI